MSSSSSNDISMLLPPFETYFLQTPYPNDPEIDPNNTDYIVHWPLSEFELLSDSKVRELLLQPTSEESETYKNFEMFFSDGVGVPGHLPNVSDLGGISPVLPIMLRWSMEKLEAEGAVDRMPHYFLPLLDPIPSIEFAKPGYALLGSPIRLILASYSDGFQLARTSVESCYLQVSIEKRMSQDTFGKPTGIATYTIQVVAETDVKQGPKTLPVGTTIICWNVRGISRPSFRDNLARVLGMHSPSVLVLTETRISWKNCRRLMNRYSAGYGWDVVEPTGFAGGVVFIWNKLCFNIEIVDPYMDSTIGGLICAFLKANEVNKARRRLFSHC